MLGNTYSGLEKNLFPRLKITEIGMVTLPLEQKFQYLDQCCISSLFLRTLQVIFSWIDYLEDTWPPSAAITWLAPAGYPVGS